LLTAKTIHRKIKHYFNLLTTTWCIDDLIYWKCF